jgi:hypothetical protein
VCASACACLCVCVCVCVCVCGYKIKSITCLKVKINYVNQLKNIDKGVERLSTVNSRLTFVRRDVTNCFFFFEPQLITPPPLYFIH